MPRLVSPLGVVVNVSDSKAVRLLSEGFRPVESDAKPVPKIRRPRKRS